MRNIELRHTFPHLLPGRSLKNLVPGFVLALLAMPALAAEQSQGNVLTLGGGVDVAPRYSGSDKTRVSAAQVVEYAMANGFFIGTTRGIGYGNNIGNLDYSAALSYRVGRKDKDVSSDSISSGSDELRGMGEIKGSAIIVPGLEYRVTDWLHLQMQVEVPVSERDNGEAVHFGISSPFYTSLTDLSKAPLCRNDKHGRYDNTHIHSKIRRKIILEPMIYIGRKSYPRCFFKIMV
jgi:outer membrane scaffolding protein for murein synthesis (MipA/OmpV family)